jgi:hypothetical protein
MRLAFRQPSLIDLVTVVFIVGAVALRLAGASTLSFLVLALLALLSAPNAILALSLGWLFSSLSPGIAPGGEGGSVGRYLLLIAALLAAMINNLPFFLYGRMPRLAVVSLLIWAFITLHSLLFSPFPDVSVLKALSWAIAVVALLALWSSMPAEQQTLTFHRVYYLLIAVLVLSLPLAGTSVGYLTNGTGLQGILDQPQAFGITAGMVGAIAGGTLLGQSRPPWSTIVIFGLAMLCAILSEARTAGLAMLLGLLIAIIFAPMLSRRPTREMLPGLRSKRVYAIFGTAVIALMAAAPLVMQVAFTYITKSNRADVGNIFEAYDASRGNVIGIMMENIESQLFSGIGFGIASDPRTMAVARDPVLGLPTGAPVEKGVAPLAVVEEIGLLGATLVLYWIVLLFKKGANNGLPQLAILSTLILINFAEAIFFSVGGMGMLAMILMIWAYCSSPAASKLQPSAA